MNKPWESDDGSSLNQIKSAFFSWFSITFLFLKTREMDDDKQLEWGQLWILINNSHLASDIALTKYIYISIILQYPFSIIWVCLKIVYP